MIGKIILVLMALAFVGLVIRKVWTLTAGRKRREIQELARRVRENDEQKAIFAMRPR